ncbi:MAG: hypothetical protein ABIP95_14285 [Pelobium sp.]
MNNLKSVLKTALIISPLMVMFSCKNNDAKYENLATGEKVYIIKDNDMGKAIDSISGKPVRFYVNLETKDTINGETGLVVNNQIVKTDDGYEMAKSDLQKEIDEMKAQGDVKIKVDGDEMKIKTDDKKIKIDGDDKKVKYDN